MHRPYPHHGHHHQDHGHQHGQGEIHNPVLPFNSPIPGGLQPGDRIIVKGFVLSHCERFHINLNTNNGSTALHINPRFSCSQIVRNTNRGSWGAEERHGPFPFHHNAEFLAVVTAESDHFKAAVNGNHVFDYHHRIPLNEVANLEIGGDIKCHSIKFEKINQPSYPSRGLEVFNPPLPVNLNLTSGFAPGKMIQITGHIPHHANRFQVNLQSHSGDVALHFNPRWDEGHVVVRNSKRNGAWEREERNGPAFPFHKGANFDMLVLNENNQYKIAVNGTHFIEFAHRMHDSAANILNIVGEVQIQSIRQF